MRTRIALLGMSFLCSHAMATVVAVGPGAFPASPVLNFAGLADLTEVNGLIVSGVQFTYSLGNGLVVIDGGPGTTNNVTPPNIVSIGNNTGVLGILLPTTSTVFGYGYAILNAVTVPNATTISVFNGATPLGSLSYTGVQDPDFTGGFAGIQSSLPFNRVELRFDTVTSPAFALDNIRFGSFASLPEPSTWALTLGAAVLLLLPKTRRAFRKD